jgi:hypothetical protein
LQKQKGEGELNSADDWANSLNTISWEILCGFKDRLLRIAVNNLSRSKMIAKSWAYLGNHK